MVGQSLDRSDSRSVGRSTGRTVTRKPGAILRTTNLQDPWTIDKIFAVIVDKHVSNVFDDLGSN